MESICGISGNFKLALQVSMETHCLSSLQSLARSFSLPHKCGLCSNGSFTENISRKGQLNKNNSVTSCAPVKKELYGDKTVTSSIPESGEDTEEKLDIDIKVVIKQELDEDIEQEPKSKTCTAITEGQQFGLVNSQRNTDSTDSSNALVTGKQPPMIPGVAEPFSCGICHETFANRTTVRQHFVCHRGTKSYMCTVCSKTFRKLTNLNQHLVIHTGIKQFMCNHCPSNFFRAPELARHMKIHSSEQHYTCQFCMKSFMRSNSLKRHERVHSGERPYLCVYCGKTYKDYGHLRSHKFIHTGEKPYSCEVCLKLFRMKKFLIKHKCPGKKTVASTTVSYDPIFTFLLQSP